MMEPMLPIPPLPASWPFAPRVAAPCPPPRAGARLPGLDGAWDLAAPADLAFQGDPEPLGGSFGRGGVYRVGDVVLRPYRRGGLVRHLNAAIYPAPDRFAREYRVHRALWEAGFPTVEPLGWAHRARLWGCEGVFLTRFAGGTPWPRAWDEAALPRVRALLEALCAWGLYAPDLNATNFQVLPGGEVLALDWDKARWLPGEDLAERYRERLARSLRKLGAPAEFVI